jgi:hypothetical protein
MSFPTIVVSPSNIPASIQVATPFSYIFTNSGPVPPGSNVYSPLYTPYTPSQVTLTTTGSYSSNNTLVTTVQPNTTIDPIYGLVYSEADVTTGSDFTFKIPYPSTPARGTIGFTLNLWSMYVVDDTQRYISNGSNFFEYSNGDTITYRKRSTQGFDVLCNSTVKFTEENAYSIQFNSSFFWYLATYPEWTSNYYSIGDRVIVSNSYFESLSDYNYNNFPYDTTNFVYWFIYSVVYPQWQQLTNYLQGERVTYNSLNYESLPFNNLSAIPPDRPDVWQLVAPISAPTWSVSTTYGSPGNLVNYNGVTYFNLAFSNLGHEPTALENYVYWKPTDPPSNPAVTFTIAAPDKVVYYPATFPLLYVSSLTSSQILPFISGQGTSELTFASTTGFQSVPTSNLTLIVYQTILESPAGTPTSNTITVDPIVITVNPELSNPLSLVTYEPFEYIFSIPNNVVNVVLQSNALVTSSNLAQFISNNSSFETSFSSFVGFTTPGVSFLQFWAVLNGNFALASNTTTINTISSGITITPPIPTGSLALFRYESFSHIFTTNPNSLDVTLQFTRSSSDLQTLCSLSSDQQTVTFAGSFVSSFSTNLSLIIDLLFEGNIINTTTILVSVGQARFFPPSSNQNFQLYQYENVSNTFGSNIQFLTALPITNIVSIPSLPTGLTFGGSCNSFFIQGTPLLQVLQSNYQVIGSNSNNGRIASTIVSIKVNAQQVVITPNTPTISTLTVDSTIVPVTLTAIKPETIYSNVFRYTWSGLPDGLYFEDINETIVTSPFIPPDNALTIILAGSPSLDFARLVAASGANLYQMRLFGTQSENTGKQTIGSALFNFSLSETVFINVSNSTILYKDKPLGVTEFLITAENYFSSSTISNISADSLPPGLSLVQYTGPNVYRLSGTPTEVNLVGSYTFTATNFNGNSRSITTTIPVNPNVITFVGSTPPNGTVIRFIVSRPLSTPKTGYYTSPIIFTAVSTASAYPITYTSSIDFLLYGLVFNSSTGTLTGIPTIPLSEVTVTITAVEGTIGTTGSTTIVLTILEDEFTWPFYFPTYIQNKDITPFQFVMTSTLSERSIQSFSSTNLPTGLVITAGGLLSGKPTVYVVDGIGTFIITATTGYSTLSRTYIYSIVGDQMLIVQENSSDVIQKVFTNIAFKGILYSSDTFVNATFSIVSSSLPASGTISITSGGLLSGNLTNALLNTNYTVAIAANFGTINASTNLILRFSDITGSGIGVVYIPTENTNLTFIQPTQTAFTLLEYVPYSFTFKTFGAERDPDPLKRIGFVYFYTNNIPNGFQILKTIEDDFTTNTLVLSGISATLDTQTITVYAQAESYPASITISLRTITPFFVNPQSGAGAYTALLRNDVLGNAAQNARDNRVFPEVNPLAGPLMAPRAPDVTTPNDCILKLCKKPCPTCHTMM